MAAVEVSEARVFELLGRASAECQERAAHAAALEWRLRQLTEEHERLLAEAADLRTRLRGAEALLDATPPRREATPPRRRRA